MTVEKKKYIIELPENTHWIQWIMESTKDHHPYMDYKQAEDLTPYTESNLDAIRNEAYEKGVQDTKQHWVDAPRTCAYKLGYENGLNDLWEAMQKAIKMYCEIDNEVFLRVFHDVKCDWGESVLQALFKNTPQHVIDSIRKYEESKEKHTWIFSEVNEPSVDTTLICSECGYTMKMRIGDTPALNFCPKCGDCKKPREEET